MPRGDDEEIAIRADDFFRFAALPATRALLEPPTWTPSLVATSELVARIILQSALRYGCDAPGCVHMRIRGRTHASASAFPVICSEREWQCRGSSSGLICSRRDTWPRDMLVGLELALKQLLPRHIVMRPIMTLARGQRMPWIRAERIGRPRLRH